MSSAKSEFFSYDTSAGRNGFNSPDALLPNECADMVNCYRGAANFAQKRGGANNMPMANAPFSGIISSLGVHIPGTDPTSAELWATDEASVPEPGVVLGRFSANNWTTPTLPDAPTGNGWDFDYQSLDGKFHIAYKNAANRHHVWDGSTVRRTGLAPAVAAPTVANQGSGSYPATLRYYRVRFVQRDAGVNVRTSEPSPSVSFTPSGTGGAARVTRPTAPSEGETHWILEASEDDATFYQLGTPPTALATTTFDDNVLPQNYDSFPLSPTVGSYALQKNYRFVAADQNRLLGFSSYVPTDPQNRIEFSDIVGGTILGAAEIAPAGNNYVSLNERAAGAITGAAGPIDGFFLAFLYSQVHKLVPTGNPAIPYQPVCISAVIGAVNNQGIVLAEDEEGNPCAYWMSERGVYRWGGQQVRYIGNGVEDLILGPTSVMNTSATKVITHAVFNRDKREIEWFFAVGAENEPTTTSIVFHIGRVGGTAPSDRPIYSYWTRNTGEHCKARASVLYAATLGTAVSRSVKPYIAYSGANNKIWKTDTTDLNDAGAAFRGFVTSRVMTQWGQQNDGEVGLCFVQTKSANNVTLTQTLIGNFGQDNYTSNTIADLTPENNETRVFRQFQGIGRSGLKNAQFVWGDEGASNNTWFIDKVLFEASSDGVA
jgi:hypothetical protein